MFKLKTSITVFAIVTTTALHAQNFTGPWYNAAESGWGLNIVHQGDVLFPTWFTYDTDGKPLWLVVSGATKQADASYVGDIYRVVGVPFNQINGVASRTVTKLGSAKLSFANTGALSFNYTLNNMPTQTNVLTRVPIGSGTPVCETTIASRATATNYSDIWWNPQESGWGINLFHQDNLMFATWFTYDANGRDTWYTVSRAEAQADGSFTGAIQQVTTGTPYNQINGTPAFPAGGAPNVGNMTFRFTNGEKGSMTYTIGNVTQTKTFERQQFSAPAQVCRSGTPAPVVNADSCDHILQLGQTRRVRTSSPNAANSTRTERGMGAHTFDGKASQMWETFDEANRLTTRQYARINSDATYENIGFEAFDAATGVMAVRGRYSENRFKLNPPIGSTETLNYMITQDNFLPASSQTVITYNQTVSRVANETITVPAGTFINTCKRNITTNASTTQQGFAITTRTVGPVWTNGIVGGIKVQAESTVSAGFPLPPTTSEDELLEFIQN
jgi:hypothetical protein